MKRKGFLLSLLVFPVLLATFTMASAAVTPYTLSLEPTTNGTDPKSVFNPGDVFYMNIVVDDAGGIAGCAFTLNFDPSVLTPPSTTADGLPLVSGEITSIFPFFTSGVTTHRENSSELGKIYFSGAEINTSNGGAKYTSSTGKVDLFTVKMKVNDNAPLGLSGVSLTQTELFNPAAGYGVDEGTPGVYDEGTDQMGKVSVLVGALPNTDGRWTILEEAFPILMGDQPGPLDELQIHVTEAPCADRDQDGLCDSYETDTGTYVSPTDTGTDPDALDTDEDGLSDGAEVHATTPTNPTMADTDHDGYRDGVDANPLAATDPPGGQNYNPPEDLRLYQISGTIGYGGQERQQIHVGIFDDAGLTASLGGVLVDSSSGTSPWNYTITNVPARNTYYIAAYMDVDGNNQPGNEPKGQIGPFAIAAVMANKNVELALVKDWSGTWNLSFSGFKADGSPKAEVIPVTIAKEADGSYIGSFVDSESIEYDLTGEFVGENFFSVTEISGKGKAYGKGTVFGSDIAGRNDLQGATSTFRATHNPPAISNLDLSGFWSMTCSLSGSGWTSADGNGPSARSFSFNAVPTGTANEYRGTFEAEDGTCTITLTANGNRITWIIDQTGNYQANGAGTCIIDSTSPRVMGPFSGKSLDAADPNGKDIGSFSARFTPPPSGKVVVGSPSASIYHGMTFKVPVMIDAGSSVLGSYSLKVLFDKNVVNIAAVSGGSTAEFAATPTYGMNNTDGFVTLAAYQGGTESPTGAVHVADLTFNVVGLSGSKTSLTVDQDYTVYDPNDTPINVTAKNGWVQVGPARVDVGTVSPLKVMSGETVYVPVSIGWALNEVIGSYTFQMTFDPTILHAHAVTGGQTPEFSGTPSFNIDNTNGVVTFGAFNSSNVSPQGFAGISGVTLQALEIQDDVETVVGLNVTNLFNEQAQPIGSYVEGVKVIVTVGLCGDVSQNGRTDIGDAMFIAQYVVGNRPASALNLKVGDVTGNGRVDIGDAMFIAQYVVGNRDCLCVGTVREMCSD